MKAWLIGVLSAVSQLLNKVFLNGHPNESISGRAHREPWPKTKRRIDAVFRFAFGQQQHCEDAYLNDKDWAEEYLAMDAAKK